MPRVCAAPLVGQHRTQLVLACGHAASRVTAVKAGMQCQFSAALLVGQHGHSSHLPVAVNVSGVPWGSWHHGAQQELALGVAGALRTCKSWQVPGGLLADLCGRPSSRQVLRPLGPGLQQMSAVLWQARLVYCPPAKLPVPGWTGTHLVLHLQRFSHTHHDGSLPVSLPACWPASLLLGPAPASCMATSPSWSFFAASGAPPWAASAGEAAAVALPAAAGALPAAGWLSG